MTREAVTAPEELFTALFAAGEAAVLSGRTAPAPAGAGVPAEVEQRLQRDLECVRLLRRALGPAPEGSTLPLPPPQAPSPPAVRLDLAAGRPAEAAEDLRPLLWRRLRFSSLCILTVHSYFTVTSPLRFRPADLGSWLYHGPTWIAFLVTAGLAIVLWHRPSLSLRRLRLIELTLFGLALVDWTKTLYWIVLKDDQLLEFYWLAESSARGETLLCIYATAWTTPYVFLIIGYAAVIPSDWRRCTAIVSVFAATPVLMAMAAIPFVLPILSAYLLFFLLPMVMCLGLIVAITAYGTRRIELLRQEAAAARKLGQYQLKHRLGAGGMGEVYLAEHLLLKQPCAIKLIRPEKAGDSAILRRFEREVQTTARLNHWNTVQIFDYGHAADGTFYYVMEYLPGLTLEELVKQQGPLPPARAVHLLRQACQALREAHAHGLIHRDIKPANLMLCERGGIHDVIKVLDFGLVKTVGLDGDDDKLTQEGAIAGTPAYMSPEQAVGKEDLDARSDIYSLGAVAYFLLTGQPPFRRAKPIEMIVAHLQETARPLSHIDGDVPADVQSVVLRCLKKDPDRRFADAEGLERALAACACAGTWTEETAARWWQSQVAAR